MATIDERKDSQVKITYRVQVRIKGIPIQRATFLRKTDAKIWAQQTEAAIREGRHFKTTESKKHTVGEMIDYGLRSPHRAYRILSYFVIFYSDWDLMSAESMRSGSSRLSKPSNREEKLTMKL